MTATALRPLPTTTTDATTAAFTIARLLDDHPALPLVRYTLDVHQPNWADDVTVHVSVQAADITLPDACRIAAVLAWQDELDLDVTTVLDVKFDGNGESSTLLRLEAHGIYDGIEIVVRTTTTVAAYQAAVRDLRGQVAS